MDDRTDLTPSCCTSSLSSSCPGEAQGRHLTSVSHLRSLGLGESQDKPQYSGVPEDLSAWPRGNSQEMQDGTPRPTSSLAALDFFKGCPGYSGRCKLHPFHLCPTRHDGACPSFQHSGRLRQEDYKFDQPGQLRPCLKKKIFFFFLKI